jgi:hypothetical protein
MFVLIVSIFMSTVNTVGYSGLFVYLLFVVVCCCCLVVIGSSNLIYPWFIISYIHFLPLCVNITYGILAPEFIYKLFPPCRRRSEEREEQAGLINGLLIYE